MPGILKDNKEEVILGEKTNNKLHICDKLKGEAQAMAEAVEQCQEEIAPHHIVDTGDHVANGTTREDMSNGRTSRDSSTDSELQVSSSSDNEADRSTASETTVEPCIESRDVVSPEQGVENTSLNGNSEELKAGGDTLPNQGEEKGQGEEKDQGEEKSQSSKSGKVGGEGAGKVFTIHLVLPGVQQPVDVVLMGHDTVQDMLQFAVERLESLCRTALSARHKGKKLDDFVELGSIEGLELEDTVEVVEELYTQRDARVHVQRVKELLSTDPFKQGLAGADGFSLSFLSAIASVDGDAGSKLCPTDLDVPDFIFPRDVEESYEVSLDSFYPPGFGKNSKFPECLKSFCYSSWNPPPSYRKMKGDLLYLEIVTLEGQECFITATPAGFFLNKSTSKENFDPTPRKNSTCHKHLVALLCQVSPLFKKNFSQLQKFGESMHGFELHPVPYQVVPWVSPPPQHKASNYKIDNAMSLQVLPDEFVMGQVRDWNEEMQSFQEYPVDTHSARVFRDRIIFKMHVDFTQACTRGAMAIVDGCLQSLNPGVEFKNRLFLWNNIFFSLAFDSTNQFSELGGDSAAHAAAASNLHGVGTFEQMQNKGLFTSGTVLVDYRGYRVMCQTVVPGVLQREHESSVVYGSLDGGKNIKVDPHFCELLEKSSRELHIRSHNLRTEKGEIVAMPSSVEVKGIKGTDGRYYAMDLCRIFPPDANFVEDSEQPEAKWRHKMAVLRPECLDTFFNYKIMMFLRLVKEYADAFKSDATDTAAAEGGSEQTAPSSSSVDRPGGEEAAAMEGVNTGTSTGSTSSDSKESAVPEPAHDGKPPGNSEAEESSTCTVNDESNLMASPQCSATLRPEMSLLKPHPLNTVGVMSGRGAFSSLASTTSKPLLEDMAEDGETVVRDDLCLVDTLAQNEKEVDDIPGGIPEAIPDKELQAAREQDLKVPQTEAQSSGASAFKKALEESGSQSQEEFLLQFNVDILTPQLQHAEDEAVLKKDRELVKEASDFLVESVIVRFIHDCIQLVVTPMDGEGLSKAMHSRGINLRYLGRVAKLAALREDLHHVVRLCLSEMTTRLAKRKLRALLQSCPIESTSECVCHFLNCLFSTVKGEAKEETAANGQVKKKNKKKRSFKVQKPVHLRLCSASLWEEIVDEMDWYYKFKTEYANLNEMCTKNGINKTSMLRSVCKKAGIQVLARSYNFSVHPVFNEEDVVALYPIVSHTEVRPMEAVAVFDMAVSKYGLGQVHIAYELFSNALHMFLQVYGPMHLDIANCYRHLARIEYVTNAPVKALGNQHKATLILERVLGVDHYETVSAYINLALYCYTANQSLPALRLLYRARYLILMLFGEGHPELATCDINIAVILHSFRNYHHSNVFLRSALTVQNRYNGEQSAEVALTHHLLARMHAFLMDFRTALSHEKMAFSIYNRKYGNEHKKTKDSSQYLNDLTGKAVSVQKSITEMAGKSGGSGKLWGELLGSRGELDMANGVVDKSKPKTQTQKKKNRKQKQQQSASSITSSEKN